MTVMELMNALNRYATGLRTPDVNVIDANDGEHFTIESVIDNEDTGIVEVRIARVSA